MKEKLKNDAIVALVAAVIVSRLDIFVLLITYPIVFGCFALISIIIVKSGVMLKPWMEKLIKIALLILVVLAIISFTANK